MGDTEDEELPDPPLEELPFEEEVGIVSFILPSWWDDNPDAVTEAVAVAEWLDSPIRHREPREVIPDKPVHRLTLTVEEAAVALGISRAFAYEAVARGEIPCIRIGKRILILRVALDKMLESAGEDSE